MTLLLAQSLVTIFTVISVVHVYWALGCLLYTSPSPRD